MKKGLIEQTKETRETVSLADLVKIIFIEREKKEPRDVEEEIFQYPDKEVPKEVKNELSAAWKRVNQGIVKPTDRGTPLTGERGKRQELEANLQRSASRSEVPTTEKTAEDIGKKDSEKTR